MEELRRRQFHLPAGPNTLFHSMNYSSNRSLFASSEQVLPNGMGSTNTILRSNFGGVAFLYPFLYEGIQIRKIVLYDRRLNVRELAEATPFQEVIYITYSRKIILIIMAKTTKTFSPAGWANSSVSVSKLKFKLN